MPRFVVIEGYATRFSDPISFRAGDAIEVGKDDPEFPGWYWCRNAAGREGWVHRAFLASTDPGTTTGLRDYDARELDVAAGAQGEVLERLDLWLRVRLDTGAAGWLPESHARLLPP